MLTGSAELDTVLELAPEWEQLLRNFSEGSTGNAYEFLNRVGAKAIYLKALSLREKQSKFVKLLEAQYYLPMLSKMLSANQNLRRFLAQRRVGPGELRGQVLSFAAEIAHKLSGNLTKQLVAADEDGFKVLLPAYVQRSVHNAIIDFIRLEASWERQTLQDLSLDPQQDDPRNMVADDTAYAPESKALSAEQVSQLNQLRGSMKAMLADKEAPSEALTVVDCMFGLGLTKHSASGQELTMRECCEKLGIQGETMARRIARCQVLLDKGMELVRQKIYRDLPGIADAWQRGLNINLASRRELQQQLGLTEGEVERCIKGRQFTCAAELIDNAVLKPERLPELLKKGLVAAFVPVDINGATNRDIIDIVGVPKDIAARIVAERPFKDIRELLTRKLVTAEQLELYIRRGAVARRKGADSKRLDLNRVSLDEIVELGINAENAGLIVKLRPFLTWSEIEEFLGPDALCIPTLRQNFFLGISPG